MSSSDDFREIVFMIEMDLSIVFNQGVVNSGDPYSTLFSPRLHSSSNYILIINFTRVYL